MTLDQNDGAGELTGEPRHLLERCVDVGVVQLAGNRLLEVIAGRLVRIGGVRIEIDAYRLCQDRRFGRSLAETRRCEGGDALIGLMRERSLLLNALDDTRSP